MDRKAKTHPNILLLKRVISELGSLTENIVFVGGATTTLYLTVQEQVEQARGTIDVDLILDVGRVTFHKIESTLRDLGFSHDQKTTFAGRKGLLKDLMSLPKEVKEFVKAEFERFLLDENFFDALRGHIPRIENHQQLAVQIESDLREFLVSQ